jgi:hypothetical protein
MAGNSKNALPPFKAISAGDMSGTITGPATGIQYLDNVSIQLNFTGTPTGTFQVQGSLDYVPNLTPGNWVPLVLPTSPIANGVAGNILIDLNQLSFPYIRIVYVPVSGVGALNCYVSGKAV